MAFKVKTTAPKLYSVRPNASIVPPGKDVKVAIILQAFSQPLSKHYKCKDKFLIVSLPCSEDADASKVSEFWPALEKEKKSEMSQKKLKVNYVVEGDDDAITEETDKEPASGAASASGAGAGAAAGAAIGSGVSKTPAAPDAPAPAPPVSASPLDKTDDEDITDSYKQINQMNEKFDKTEQEKPVAQKSPEPFGLSLPFTVILMLVAFIIGWLIF